MIAHNNVPHIRNWLMHSLARLVAGKSIRTTGNSPIASECLKFFPPPRNDRTFLPFFERPKFSDGKRINDNVEESRETKDYRFPRSRTNETNDPPKVSEDSFVLRRTFKRDKKNFDSDEFATKFVHEESWKVRAPPRPPTIPPPHPGCPPPPPGCGYCPPCPPRREIIPPASPPGDRNPPKPKYPPCPDRDSGESKPKCPSDRPSPCDSKNIVEKPSRPAKCPEDSGKSKKCSPPLPIKDTSMILAPKLPAKLTDRSYSRSTTDKRGNSKCPSKSKCTKKSKSGESVDDKCEKPAGDGRVICIKPSRKNKRGDSLKRSSGSKKCGKTPCTDSSKSPCRSFSSGSSSIRFFADGDEKYEKIFATKRAKPGPTCRDEKRPDKCDGTKNRSGKGYKRRRVSSDCENIPKNEKASNAKEGNEKKFNPCGSVKSS